jgi:branched-chain amino acid transport system ATP-binding protein
VNSSEPLLALTDLSISFGGLRALQGLSLELRRGEILGLIGPNGAGKTTLFNVITRLYDPDSGEARFNGDDIFRLRPHQVIARGLARTFQNLLLFNDMTVLDNVLVGLHSRMEAGTLACAFRLPRERAEDRRARERALEVLELVGLAAEATRPARTLPFGHQRLLELARALASRPRLLLLDEPGAGMSAEELDTLTRVILRIHEQEGIALLLIGHTMRLVLGISHRVAVLDHGVKIAEGPPPAIRENSLVVQAYLGKVQAGAAP